VQIYSGNLNVGHDVVCGKLAPGERLRVEHLKDQYAVGAGTLREALSLLVADALVTSEGQRGFRVAPISMEDLEDVTNTRVMLETEVAIHRDIDVVAPLGIEIMGKYAPGGDLPDEAKAMFRKQAEKRKIEELLGMKSSHADAAAAEWYDSFGQRTEKMAEREAKQQIAKLGARHREQLATRPLRVCRCCPPM
jgi:DNA-binding transcriptional regulator YhcF (GntR family)